MKNIIGRDDYIIAKALYLALKYIDQLPRIERPEGDAIDMARI